jgi:uncharacterized membrane protein YdjX (TVP38/TMEM64 family)
MLKIACGVLGLIALALCAFMGVKSMSNSDASTLSDLGPVVFAVACVVSAFPIPTLFTAACVGCGLCFGLVRGLAVALPSCLVGMVVAFEASRYCFRDAAQGYVHKYASDLVSAAARHPRKGVVLLRLLPVPFSFQNVFWGSCTDVSTVNYALYSALVVVPHVGILVYIGGTSKTLGEALEKRPSAAVPVIAALCLLGGLVWYAGRYARRALVEDDEDDRPIRAVYPLFVRHLRLRCCLDNGDRQRIVRVCRKKHGPQDDNPQVGGDLLSETQSGVHVRRGRGRG